MKNTNQCTWNPGKSGIGSSVNLYAFKITDGQGFLDAILDGIVENERDRRIENGTIDGFDADEYAKSVIKQVFGT
mgnify:CR=1 FL=1